MVADVVVILLKKVMGGYSLNKEHTIHKTMLMKHFASQNSSIV